MKYRETSTGEIKPRAGQEEARLCIGHGEYTDADQLLSSSFISLIITQQCHGGHLSILSLVIPKTRSVIFLNEHFESVRSA